MSTRAILSHLITHSHAIAGLEINNNTPWETYREIDSKVIMLKKFSITLRKYKQTSIKGNDFLYVFKQICYSLQNDKMYGNAKVLALASSSANDFIQKLKIGKHSKQVCGHFRFCVQNWKCQCVCAPSNIVYNYTLREFRWTLMFSVAIRSNRIKSHPKKNDEEMNWTIMGKRWCLIQSDTHNNIKVSPSFHFECVFFLSFFAREYLFSEFLSVLFCCWKK